jgi:hypothetical protein
MARVELAPGGLGGWKVWLALIAPLPLLANTGIPMVMMTMPLMVVVLAPIVLLEAWVVKRITGESFKRTLSVMLRANLWTTVLGLPLSNLLTWLMNVAAEAVLPRITRDTFHAHGPLLKALLRNHWFDPIKAYDMTRGADGVWIKPVEPWWYFGLALTFAFLVHLLVSTWIEYSYMKRHLQNPAPVVKQAAIRANLASYCFLVLVTLTIMFVQR